MSSTKEFIINYDRGINLYWYDPKYNSVSIETPEISIEVVKMFSRTMIPLFQFWTTDSRMWLSLNSTPSKYFEVKKRDPSGTIAVTYNINPGVHPSHRGFENCKLEAYFMKDGVNPSAATDFFNTTLSTIPWEWDGEKQKMLMVCLKLKSNKVKNPIQQLDKSNMYSNDDNIVVAEEKKDGIIRLYGQTWGDDLMYF